MAKDTFLNRKQTLNCNGRALDLSNPLVMAILNITPDSFFADSRATEIDSALTRTEKLLNEGATIIDIGAYSSRPHAEDISVDEELSRLIPVVEAISKKFPEAFLSIDTFRAKVAQEAIQAGGHIVNDIAAGGLDEAMFETVASLQVPYIAMHMRGNPKTMQQLTDYENVTLETIDYFQEKIKKLNQLGITNVIVDPGFGFAKTVAQNYELLQNLEQFHQFELPLLVGFSRKSMITKLLDIKSADALNGTTVLNTIALQKGAKILRVHDVKEAVECVKLVKQLHV